MPKRFRTDSVLTQMEAYENMIKVYDLKDNNKIGRLRTFEEIENETNLALAKGKEKEMIAIAPVKKTEDKDEEKDDVISDEDVVTEAQEVVQTLSGAVSFYGKEEHGGPTASGERFNMYAETCAHKSLPFDTMIRVTNKTNGKSTICRVNDRGPYIKGRTIDLSCKSFTNIASVQKGVLKSSEVAIEVIEMGKGKYKKNRIYSSK